VTEFEALFFGQLGQVDFLDLGYRFFLSLLISLLSPPAALACLLLERFDQLGHLGTLENVYLVAFQVLDVVEEER